MWGGNQVLKKNVMWPVCGLFYYPKIDHIHCVIKSLHLWGTNVLRFPHLWFDIGNICAGPGGNIWKTFLGFYDMQSDLCFGTSVWFLPVALPSGNVLLIGISLGDWKKPGFLTSAGRQEMFQKNLRIVRVPRRRRCWVMGLTHFNHDSLIPGSRWREGKGTWLLGQNFPRCFLQMKMFMAKQTSLHHWDKPVSERLILLKVTQLISDIYLFFKLLFF